MTLSGNIYTTAVNHIVALDPNGNIIWHHEAPAGVYPSAVSVLSDGTLVVGALDGFVYFLKEKNVKNGGIAQGGWPTSGHDNYHSNNAAHLQKWDRSGEEPYPSLQSMLADLPEDWMCNEDNRCYPDEYYSTCDWGGTFDWAGKEISCDDPNAVKTPCPNPCPNPRRTPCMIEGAQPEEVCGDTDTDTDPDTDTDTVTETSTPSSCNCNSVGIGGGIGGLLILLLLAVGLVRQRRSNI